MMGTVSLGLALACAAMMALMCLPMAVGMIRSRRRRWHTTTPSTPSAAPATRTASTDGN